MLLRKKVKNLYCRDGPHDESSELSTVQHGKLNIKLFLINNDGYAMHNKRKNNGLEQIITLPATEVCPSDFQTIGKACGFSCTEISENKHVDDRIRETLEVHGPVLCDIKISRHHRVIPQSRFGRPIEDSDPMLSREEFLKI